MKRCWMLMVLIILTGCSDRHVIEQVGFVNTLGFDKEENSEEDEILLTGVVPQIAPEAGNDRELLTTITSSEEQGILDLGRQSNREIENGQLRNILFGSELAEEGIKENIITMNRDPIFGTRAQVVVVNGQANQLLSQPYTQHPEASQYIDRLLKKESRLKNVPETRIHQFTRDLYDDGVDPVTAVIKQGNDKVVLDGIGLFKNDQYVDKVDPSEARIFFFLIGNSSSGAVNLNLSQEEENPVEALFNAIHHTSSITVKNPSDPEALEIVIEIKVKGALLEYDGSLDLGDNKDLNKLKSQLGASIERRCENLVKLLQDNEVDSAGLGKSVRNRLSYNEWKKLNWQETYPDVPITIKVDTKINNTGVFT
ncbi:Ger(x)C family spore germination protein [Salibacterium aidingense]|uniref:Ger(x)C family spore germination protein n=1 Tax=Salibacterium aidingense TaxID=384933 RepID=UPI000412BFA3|nr:Ger(x)C family spore germination protein [Salibacterium aidingense]